MPATEFHIECVLFLLITVLIASNTIFIDNRCGKENYLALRGDWWNRDNQSANKGLVRLWISVYSRPSYLYSSLDLPDKRRGPKDWHPPQPAMQFIECRILVQYESQIQFLPLEPAAGHR